MNNNFFYHPISSLDPSTNPYFYYASPSATASPPVLTAPSGATFSATVASASPTISPADVTGMSITLAAFIAIWLWAMFKR